MHNVLLRVWRMLLVLSLITSSFAAELAALAADSGPNSALGAVAISEIRIDQPGTDNDEYFELTGPAATSLNGLTYVVIGDGSGGSGVIEAIADLNGQTIPADGYFLAAEATFTLGGVTPDLVTNLNFENGDNVTHILVSGFTGTDQQDLDTNDDGVLDITPWTAVEDCLAVLNTVGSGDKVYCSTTIGPDGTFAPGQMFKCAADWTIGAFDPAGGDDTPGAANACSSPANLTVSKSTPGQALAGAALNYEIMVANAGGSDAASVVLTDTLPAGVDFITYTADLPVSLLQTSGGVLVWDLGSVSPITPVNLTVHTFISSTVAGVIVNEVQVATTSPESNTGDNSDAVSTYVSQQAPFELNLLGTYRTGIYNSGAAKIPAYDPATQRVFVANGNTGGIDVLDISNPMSPTLAFTISLAAYGIGANSVDVFDGLVAAAVENYTKTLPGSVVLFDAGGVFLAQLPAGALPDMLTFTPDGSYLLVANEGEPNNDYTEDPEGSITVIALAETLTNSQITQIGFTHITTDTLDPAVRVFGPGATPAQDFEPEYIATDGQTAWVTLQENNALAIVDLETLTVTQVIPLGFVDYTLPGNALDPSDQDLAIAIANWPVYGMFQPDGIAVYHVGGIPYLITANEGDARNYAGFAEEVRVNNLILDSTVFSPTAAYTPDAALGRLNVTEVDGDTDNDNDYDALYAFGTRSLSVWNGLTGELVYDSGSAFEQITAAAYPGHFNADNTSNSFDDRSDNKGPEPEGVELAELNGRVYALVGFERIGGVIVFDVTDPVAPTFVQYLNNRNFSQLPSSPLAGDLGPEGLHFVAAADSPTGKPLLVVANEVSGSTTVYEITVPAEVTVELTAPTLGAAGKPLAYEVTITNLSDTLAQNVILTDTVPISLAYVSDSSGVTPLMVAPGVYQWNLGSLGAQSSFSFVITTSVDESLPNPTVIENQVAVTADGDSPLGNIDSVQTTVYLFRTIAQVQTPTDVNVSDASPYVNQRVWVEGVVTAAPGDIDNPTRMMVIQDPAGGAYSGLNIFKSAGFANYPEGTLLRVLGLVKEYYGLTELDLSFGDAAIEVLGSVAPLAPESLTTADFPDTGAGTSELWEGVYIQFESATVTNDNLGNGEWYFDDGSGAVRADDLGERDGDLTYLPANGDVYNFIRGIGWYSFSNYKLVPRSDADIALFQPYPQVSKVAPANVDPGALFTYTLTVENLTGKTLTGVVLTDVLPAENAAFAYALDGGTLSGDTLLWNLGNLADQQQVQVRFVMTATGDMGALILNQLYAVSATNFVTPTFGTPVVTTIGEYTPIPTIQGEGMSSTFDGVTVTTRGVVVGRLQGNSSVAGNFNGFYIQDFPGDGNPNTSDGIFVNHGTAGYTANVGDLVEVTGVVQEFDEYDGVDCTGDVCVTQIAVSTANITVLSSGNAYTPTLLQPVGDPAASTTYYEAHEGMLMTFPFTATVVGPTSYGTIQVIPGNLGLTRVLRNTLYEGLPVGVRPDERYGSGAPNLIVGSIVSGVDGVLTFSYGDYLLVDQDGYTVDYEQPEPAAPEAGLLPNELSFTVGTFNTLNFDAAGGATKMTKVFETIVNMGVPALLALQEVAADEVLPDLLADLNAAGYPYAYAASHPDVGGHGVAMIWRTDLVSDLTWSDQYQTCSPNGSTSSDYDPMWEACRNQGEYPLFARRPVVVTATLTLDGVPRQIVAIAVHFKSKLGGEPSDLRRLEEAQFVNELMAQLAPEYGLVMGDLNDFEDSAALQALYANEVLTNTWYTLPADERWSYLYNGVAQVLDHVLATPALAEKLDALKPLHNNAPFPYNPYSGDASVIWRTSDHDQLSARFTIPNPPPPPTYTVTFVYHDLEDVVQSGESLLITGSFNGGSTSATPMFASADASVFTATLVFDGLGNYEYKYVVQSDGDQSDWLNTDNRSITLTEGLVEVHDYRTVDVGYAVIAAPQSLTVTLGTTATLNGEVYIQNVTNSPGAARGLKAYLGYGIGNDMNTWTWVELTYTGQNGNNDVWSVTLLPEATGVYSYVVRFDGNWAGPNPAWTYGDTDGVYPGNPFNPENVGILTVVEPEPPTYTVFLPLIRR